RKLGLQEWLGSLSPPSCALHPPTTNWCQTKRRAFRSDVFVGSRTFVCANPERGLEKASDSTGTGFAQPSRPMIVRPILATLLFCTIGLWPKAAEACSCAMSGMPCDAAWRADAVFVGNVV